MWLINAWLNWLLPAHSWLLKSVILLHCLKQNKKGKKQIAWNTVPLLFVLKFWTELPRTFISKKYHSLVQKLLLFHLTGSESIPDPLLHLSYFQLKFVASVQVCRFCFQRCRAFLRVGDQHRDYHYVALTFHYSNSSLSWALQIKPKETL